jgi:hypothetical protein
LAPKSFTIPSKTSRYVLLNVLGDSWAPGHIVPSLLRSDRKREEGRRERGRRCRIWRREGGEEVTYEQESVEVPFFRQS